MADVEIRAAGTQAVTSANIADAMLFAISLDPQGWGKMSPAELRTLAANSGILSGTVDPSAGLKVAGRHQLYVNRTASTLHFHSGVIADAWVSIGGGTATAITWQDEGNARAGVTTVNLVGSGVTGAVSAGVLTVTIPGTTTPVQTHTNYVGVINGALSAVTGANFTVNGITAALTIPSYSGTRRLLFARPSTEADPSEVYLYQSGMRNTINQIHTFMKSSSTLTLGGSLHKWWGTVDLQNGFGGYVLEQVN